MEQTKCKWFVGLRLIDDDLDSEEEEKLTRRSPIIPIQAPQPVRPQPNRYLSDMVLYYLCYLYSLCITRNRMISCYSEKSYHCN